MFIPDRKEKTVSHAGCDIGECNVPFYLLMIVDWHVAWRLYDKIRILLPIVAL